MPRTIKECLADPRDKFFGKYVLPFDEMKTFAIENCETLQDLWDKANPRILCNVATRPGVLTDKELRLFACFCMRQMWHVLDDKNKALIELAERYANDQATLDELRTARKTVVNNHLNELTTDYDDPVFFCLADDARIAAETCYLSAVWGGCSYGELDYDEVYSAQAEYLRKNCKPNF